MLRAVNPNIFATTNFCRYRQQIRQQVLESLNQAGWRLDALVSYRRHAPITEPYMGMENYNPPQEPSLVILYQDEHIMVVNKPSGLLNCRGVRKRTKTAL